MAEGGILNGVDPLHTPFSLLLIQIIIIIVTCRILAIGLRYLRQPAVIAEVIGGILLGPSVFGLIPGFKDTLFPKESLVYLNVLAGLGLVFYLFLVGLELDLEMVRARIRQSLVISVAGMVLPFVVSIGTSYFLWETYLKETVAFPTLMLFLGVCMSITAFPVLARILGELHLFSTSVGIQAISAAAIDDAAAWALLALVIGIISAKTPLNALYVILMAVAFAAFMLFGVRILLSKIFDRGVNADGSISQWVIFVVFLTVLSAALCTEIIGIHAIFGGFLAGLAIPRGRGFEIMLTEKLEDFISVLFLPLFFAASGLKTNIGLLNTATAWGSVFLVIATACIGKIVGCSLAARATKLSWRESLAIGILMNTKGLVELVVLNIGLEGKVIDEQVFTIMVLMAIVTTLMTTPLITLVYPPSFYRRAEDDEDMSDSEDDGTILGSALSKHFRPLVCLPGLRFVPTMMVGLLNCYDHLLISMHIIMKNVVKMMKAPQSADSKQSKVHAVRMIEITDRTSTLMKAANHLESLKTDPVLQVFKTFGQINNVDVKPHISFTTAEEIPTDLCEVADSNHLNTIIIPWQHPKDASTALAYSQNHKVQNMIVRGVLSRFSKSVAVVLDRGMNFEITGSDQATAAVRILVPFFGGPDDREALMFALNMRHNAGTQVHVMRIKMSTAPNADDSTAGESKADGMELVKRGHSVVDIDFTDAEDDKLFQQLSELIKLEGDKIVLDNINAQSTQPFVPIIESLKAAGAAEKPFNMVVFGYMGTQWVKMAAANPELQAYNQNTANSVSVRAAFSQFLHANPQYMVATPQATLQAPNRNESLNVNTGRSIMGVFKNSLGMSTPDGATSPRESSGHPSHNSNELANAEANQYTVPHGLQIQLEGVTMEETLDPQLQAAVQAHHDKTTLRILGEVGEAVWNVAESKPSLISVRYLKH